MTISLSLRNLAALSGDAATPSYRRTDLTPGIVHFGVGGFHRAHQGVYLDGLFNLGEGRDWAVVGAGVTDFDRSTRARLKAQDCLTTVVEQSGSGAAARITGSRGRR